MLTFRLNSIQQKCISTLINVQFDSLVPTRILYQVCVHFEFNKIICILLNFCCQAVIFLFLHL